MLRARPQVYNEMFQYAKKYITDNSSYSPKISKITPYEINKNPLVIIPRCKLLLKEETLHKKEQEFSLKFEIEIYAMDKTEGTKTISRQTIIEELQELVYQIFGEHYGMKIREDKSIPNIDVNIDRQYLRFEATINENKIIYRR